MEKQRAGGRVSARKYERAKKNPDVEQTEREIGTRINFVRTKILGLDRQLDFADLLGVSRGAVGNWEGGKGIKRENLQRISDRFDVSFQWLATGHGIPRGGPKQSLEDRISACLPPDEALRFYREVEHLLDIRAEHSRARQAAQRRRTA